MNYKRRFAGYPCAIAYEKPDGKTPVQQLPWGFWLGEYPIRKGSYTWKDESGKSHRKQYVQVKLRGDSTPRWVRETEIQEQRLMEVIFVDVGQGDGCLLVTPKDEHFVIDAGERGNMYRFLKWRYGNFKKTPPLTGAIITHPDKDHYYGFNRIFGNPNIKFPTIYHNGIMERREKDPLGPRSKDGNRSYITHLIDNIDDLRKFLKTKKNWKHPKGERWDKMFPKMLNQALEKDRFGEYVRLDASMKYLPGYEPKSGKSWLPIIDVLGPVIEPDHKDKPRLRWLGDAGKTKNGHSVVLKVNYGNVKILLGGDLNQKSEDLLLQHHTEIDKMPNSWNEEEKFIEAARHVFQVDIAKACHHGSSDFSERFLRAINPIATVVSSGDDEPHGHPRADCLGALGAYSRGVRPLIFSTELARSWKEGDIHPNKAYERIEELGKEIKKLDAKGVGKNKSERKRIRGEMSRLAKILRKTIVTLGSIHLMTDGEKVLIAQKLERARGADKKWDFYRLEREGNGPLAYQSKH